MDLRNYTYKDTYHFKTIRNPYMDRSSLNLEPEINATIGKNNERSNVEIEKGEVILQPDLSGLHKAIGKKHSGGGIDVNLKPDTFVFSDDPTLHFTQKEQELFEFKTGRSKSKRKNTPAEVLKRNIDVKHYNTLINNIADVNKDSLAKSSSTKMLDKYVQSLGQVAYLQEAKKDFPDGMPPFSEGTAPVYDAQLKENMDEQKQYAKYGGKIGNPYDKMAPGGLFDIDPYKKAKTKQGNTTPTNRSNSYDRGQEYLKQWESIFPGITKWDNKKAQSAIYDFTLQNNPQAVGEMWKNFGITNEGRKHKDLMGMTNNGVFQGDVSPDQMKSLKKAYVDGMFGARQLDYTVPPVERTTHVNIPTRQVAAPTVPGAPPVPERPLMPNQVTGAPQGDTPIETRFTPEQRIAQAYSNFKFANAKRYMPYRTHVNPSYVDPQLVNPEQTVADMQGTAGAQTRNLSSLNPILRGAQAQGFTGQLMNQVPGVRSQYDNQNAGITNQFRQYNNQIRNNTTAMNAQNDQQYYRESVQGRQNYDDLKTFLGDQAMNTRTQHVQENQSLAYNLMTMDNPAYGFDFRTGNFTRKPVDIRDIPSNSKSDVIENLLGSIDINALSPSEKISLMGNLTKRDALKYLRQKKGGRINPYK